MEKNLLSLIAKDFIEEKRIPHPIPYQGSKRILSPAISRFVERPAKTLYEPFAGSAAFTLFAAANGLAERFVIGDSLVPLVELWELIVKSPSKVISRYATVWAGQQNKGLDYFNSIRDEFNSTGEPVLLLYLVARCVKNAVRFNAMGRFTQSVDKRRLGMHPDKMKLNIESAHYLLKGRVSFFKGDFVDCVAEANEHDLVYMDPPYQGTTYGRDKRYFQGVEFEELCSLLENLQDRKISFLLSYDGMTGDKKHGRDLPSELKTHRVFLNAGRSSQATLNGNDAVTLESLYIWGNLTNIKVEAPRKSSDYQLALAL